MRPLKAAVIGAGSTYTPELIEGFIDRKDNLNFQTFHYIKGLMQAVKAYEKLTVRAAVNGSRKDAIAALMIHPLIGDYNKALAVLDEMLKADAEYIPAKLLG